MNMTEPTKRVYSRRLGIEEKLRVIDLCERGYTNREISEALGVSASQVANTLSTARQRGLIGQRRDPWAEVQEQLQRKRNEQLQA